MNSKTVRYITFIPAFIIFFIVYSIIANELIYPVIDWIATSIFNHTEPQSFDSIESLGSDGTLSNRLHDNMPIYMLIARFLLSLFSFTLPAYFAVKIYPGSSRKLVIIIFMLLHLLPLVLVITLNAIDTPEVSLLTLNNVIVFIACIIGYAYSYLNLGDAPES